MNYKNQKTLQKIEILFYSFRFVFNILCEKNKKNFYYLLLQNNAIKTINESMIPGRLSNTNDFIKNFGDIKEDTKDYWGKVNAYSLVGYARKRFNENFKDDIVKRINEIMDTEDYQSRVDKIAHEILDYATEGWKNEAIDRIRCAMIDDKLNKNYCLKKQ